MSKKSEAVGFQRNNIQEQAGQNLEQRVDFNYPERCRQTRPLSCIIEGQELVLPKQNWAQLLIATAEWFIQDEKPELASLESTKIHGDRFFFLSKKAEKGSSVQLSNKKWLYTNYDPFCIVKIIGRLCKHFGIDWADVVVTYQCTNGNKPILYPTDGIVVTTLCELLQAANQWMPTESWETSQPLVIGRDILLAPTVKAQWDSGHCYLNPGRDAQTARDASDFLLSLIKNSKQRLNSVERKQAEFIPDCSEDINWCMHPIIVKILLYDDRIEVFTGDDRRVWPVQELDDWPREWTFYRMNRHVLWNKEPLSAGRYWFDRPERGPCQDGSWPRLYSRFLGCVCCTSGLFFPKFERVWSCGLPRLALASRVGGGTQTVMLPNPPTSVRALNQAAKQFDLKSIDLEQWKGSVKAYNCAYELLLGSYRMLKVPGELVRRSQTEVWPLEEQFAAEEIAGKIASDILVESQRHDFNWHSLPNNGKETIAKVDGPLKSLQGETGPLIGQDIDSHRLSKNDICDTSAQTTSDSAVKFVDDNGVLCEDIPVRSLKLSVRATNVLREANITSVRQLLDETENTLLRFRNSGKKTASEIIERVMARKRFVRDTGALHPDRELQSQLMNRFSPSEFSQTLDQLLSGLIHPSPSPSTAEKSLHELVETGKLRKEGDLYIRDFPSILEFVESIQNERDRNLVRGRLSGNTLEALGKGNGVTRERVRQIIGDALSKRQSVREDRYLDLYFAYDFPCDTFCKTFMEPEATYYYLECLRPNGKPRKSLEGLVGDSSLLTSEQRKRLNGDLLSGFVFIDGEKVPRMRTKVLEVFIKTRLKDGCTTSVALHRYRELLQELSLPESEFEYDDRSFALALRNSHHTLAGLNGRIRTYDTTCISLAMLVDDFELDRLYDVEFPTSLLKRKYPEVMQRYGISDVHELHNLFRKVAMREKGAPYRVSRMPNLLFGNGEVKVKIQKLHDTVDPI